MIEHTFFLNRRTGDLVARLDDGGVTIIAAGKAPTCFCFDQIESIAFEAWPMTGRFVRPVVRVRLKDSREVLIGRFGGQAGWWEALTRARPDDKIATFLPFVDQLMVNARRAVPDIRLTVGNGRRWRASLLWLAAPFVLLIMLAPLIFSGERGWLDAVARGLVIGLMTGVPRSWRVVREGNQRSLAAGSPLPAFLFE